MLSSVNSSKVAASFNHNYNMEVVFCAVVPVGQKGFAFTSSGRHSSYSITTFQAEIYQKCDFLNNSYSGSIVSGNV